MSTSANLKTSEQPNFKWFRGETTWRFSWFPTDSYLYPYEYYVTVFDDKNNIIVQEKFLTSRPKKEAFLILMDKAYEKLNSP